VASYGGDISRFVPSPVEKAVKEKYGLISFKESIEDGQQN
jgi:hypothetical protein